MATDSPHVTDDQSPEEERRYRHVIAANLKQLMAEAGENQSSLAEKSGVGQSTIGRYLRSDTTANIYTLKQLAQALGVSVSRITAISTHLSIEPNVISRIAGTNVQDGPPLIHVPLIAWAQLGAWTVEKAQQLQAETWLPCPVPCGPRSFAVKVRGVSMEPKFHDGDVIFVDPDVTPQHGRRVIARLDGEVLFRELVIDGERRLLSYLNPSFPGSRLVELPPSATILGVVVGKWVPEI